jgi:asparagine synthase (glutamine-hydrolysing)
MCGITGFIDSAHRRTGEAIEEQVRQMTDTLRHRGPDDGGIWTDASAGIALGFRRLAILDLSPEGHQPMRSADGRYVVVFNGEIYNFSELRHELEKLGHIFRGRSDTEIMLAAFVQWGVRETIVRLNGMFAIALWDKQARELHLVRDRLGKKPLYYGWTGQTFAFGSELKALRAHTDFHAEIDRQALALYLRYSYIPAPSSIYRDIQKLPAGCMLTLSATQTDLPQPTPYWSVYEAAARGLREPLNGSAEEVSAELDSLLRDATGKRMVADVPLGAFLSGGTDSSLVVALMQAQSNRPVKTFSIGFHESSYNEAEHAKRVAEHLGTEHTELYVTPAETRDVIPRLASLYDEPFADSSQIPTFLLSELARRHVTVSLSGDGGDELFGGYGRYFLAERLWQKLRLIPGRLRSLAAPAVLAASRPGRKNVSDDSSFTSADAAMNPTDGQERFSTFNQKLNALAEVMASDTPEQLYLELISLWKKPASVVINATDSLDHGMEQAKQVVAAFTPEMMLWDTANYLPDDILVKVDRASMGVSLEVRAPLLDYRVVEFAWRVPMSMKVRDGEGKWLLRQLLYKYVPRSICERPKMGFDVPVIAWLRGPLRDWAESLINERRLQTEGFFHAAPIRQKWREHLSGARNWQHQLWSVLMFQSWLDEQKKHEGVETLCDENTHQGTQKGFALAT